ncbi:MAG TPA: hypothetical protein VMS60_15100 [Solirubrobacterales bacterium]|nr:hypothetical protein [Solirubrobacterales bacterium]
MDESGIRRRLESLEPPNLDEARDRAKLAARVGLSRQPAAGARPGFFRVRNLSLAGGLAAVAAALVLALGTGGGSGIKAEVASAADLTHLAELAPHPHMVGGWQITNTEVTPDGGRTEFHDEDEESDDVEIRWYAASVEETGQRLESEGFEAAGTLPTRTGDALEMREAMRKLAAGEASADDDWFTSGTAQVYTSRAEDGSLSAAGVWAEDGWTFELRAPVESLDMLERLLERVEFLGPEEWLIALRPGGGEWLSNSFGGTAKEVEEVKTVQPDGMIVRETRFTGKSAEEMENFELDAPFPLITRDGDSVTVEVQVVPAETP